MQYHKINLAVDVFAFGTIITNIEQDPEYFIPLIYPHAAPKQHQHLIRKMKDYNRLELFAQMVDNDHKDTLNVYLMNEYNRALNRLKKDEQTSIHY